MSLSVWNNELSLTAADLRNPAKLKAEADRLKSQVAQLTQQCNATAVERDKLAVIHSARSAAFQEQQGHLDFLRQQTEQAYVHVSPNSNDNDDDEGEGIGILPSLEQSLNETLRWNQLVRFRLALQAFEMHRLDVGSDNDVPLCGGMNGTDDQHQAKNDNKNINNNATSEEETNQPQQPNHSNSNILKLVNLRPRGIGKVGGLPMPHSGTALYGAMPPPILTSALRLVASLTSCLSRVLAIQLPHPIDLRRPMNTGSGSTTTSTAAREREDEDRWHGDIALLSPPLSIQDSQRAATTVTVTAKAPSSTKSPSRKGLVSTSVPYTAEAQPQPQLEAQSTNVGVSASSISNTSSSSASGWSFRNTLAGAASAALSKVVSSSKSSPTKTNRGTLQQQQHNTIPRAKSNPAGAATSITIDMSQETIQQRIRHASAAVIRESITTHSSRGARTQQSSSSNSTTNTKHAITSYELHVETSASLQTEEFNIGLQLLQNDIVALCINAGVPVSSLWPAEALLLNLNALRLFCLEEVQ
jgi:hypothetical protein